MDAPVSTLVLTKIRVPALRPRAIPRRRLVDLLAPENGEAVTLVSAPAGYGKTTFLAEWARSLPGNGPAAAWYGLDPDDDDPIPFGAYLVASLTQALAPAPGLDRLAQFLRASAEVDLQSILQTVINVLVENGRDCVLILDDYHLIASPAIHSAVAYLAEHLPENMRLVLGSRSDPPLPLARLRARGQLREIRADELRFTADETALFLNQAMELDLSTEGIAALEARTEGWIAGLQLAALSLAGRPNKESFLAAFTGSHRYLVDYLLEEVFDRQPEDVRSFLLSSSILERMCAPLCDAMLAGSSRSEEILARLDQANLFVVALDDRGIWYRYHHLFRDFLQTRLLQSDPERVRSLHRAASEWLAEHDSLREAARHAFQIRDWEYAAAFVERHSFTLIVHSEMSMVYEWCSAFPEDVMRKHPMLCILQCWPLVFSFQRRNRVRIEARLRQAGQAIAVMEDRQQARSLLDHAAVVRSFLAMAPDPDLDPRKQLALAQDMLSAYGEADAGRFSALLTIGYAHMALHDAQAANDVLETARQIALSGRLFAGIVESTFQLARLAHARGQLRRAAEICRQGQADVSAMLSHPEQELPAIDCLDVALGCVLLEQDQLPEAEDRLLRGLNLIGMGLNPHYLMTACVALARLKEIQDRPGEADMYLSRLEEAWPDISFCTGALRLLPGLRTAPEEPETLAKAATWCRSFSASIREDVPPPGVGPLGAAEVFYLARLAWIRFQIALGQAQTTRPYLLRQLDLAEANNLSNRVIELSLLEARAAQAEGDDSRARAALEHALALAEPAGYIRIFDQGPAFARLLNQAAQDGIRRDYIGRILAAISVPENAASGNIGMGKGNAQASDLEITENLTNRELEVLRLVVEGATNQAIAERLVITIGTVKSHINHILVKLNAHNRTEAVSRARKLGLV